MSSETIHSLHFTNQVIRNFLRDAEDMMANQADVSGICSQIHSLWLRLEQVGKQLRGEPVPFDSDSLAERSEYTENLEQLRRALERISLQLMARRAELDAERARLQNVRRWVATAKVTDPTTTRLFLWESTAQD